MVARTDVDSDDLPTDDEGAVAEDEIEIVGEVGELEPDEDGSLTVELEAGSYVLFRNLVEEEEENGETITEAHYTEGMHTTFEVP